MRISDWSSDVCSSDLVLVHRISAEEHINPLGASSKMNAEWAFLQHLFDIGWRATDDWLAANFEHLGKRSTIDTRAMYQGEEQELPDPKLDRKSTRLNSSH